MIILVRILPHRIYSHVQCKKDTVETRHHHHHHHHHHHLTDLGSEAGHLVLQLPHPVRLSVSSGEVVLRGDLLVLTDSKTISVSALVVLSLSTELVQDIYTEKREK